MQHHTTTGPKTSVHPVPEADYLRSLTPAPAAPLLFACWQTLDGATVCRTLPVATAALAKLLDGARFDPCGEIDAASLETAFADAMPELCHPSGYQLTGIGLAAVGDGNVAVDAWVAQEAGRTRTWHQDVGGAEVQGRIGVDDQVLIIVPEARLLAALERLRAKATGTRPVLLEPACVGETANQETAAETASGRLSRALCRWTVPDIAKALIADDEEDLHDDLLRAVNELDQHDSVIGAELARIQAATDDRAAGKSVGPLHADPAHVAAIEEAFGGREAAWVRLRDLLLDARAVLGRRAIN